MCAFVGGASSAKISVDPPSRNRSELPVWRQLADIMRHPEMTPMFVVVMLGQITVFSVNPVVALYVQGMVGDSLYLGTFVGASFAVIGIADLIASPYLGKRSDQLGYRRVLLIASAGAALATIPQAFVHNIWTFMALRFGLGLFLGGVIPTVCVDRPHLPEGAARPRVRRQLQRGVPRSVPGPAFGGLAARFGLGSVFVVTGKPMPQHGPDRAHRATANAGVFRRRYTRSGFRRHALSWDHWARIQRAQAAFWSTSENLAPIA